MSRRSQRRVFDAACAQDSTVSHAQSTAYPIPRTSLSVREGYAQYGVPTYYQQFGEHYRNPHESTIVELMEYCLQHWSLDVSYVLDLACGSGEVTQAIRRIRGARIDGIDPYTGTAYRKRTGQIAEELTFEKIAQGALMGRSYSLIVCSFAMHLVDPSWLPVLIYQLSLITPQLLIISPHKRPFIEDEWGWMLVEKISINRVRAKLYLHS